MKKSVNYFLLLFLVGIMFACKKDEDKAVPETPVSNDEAAQVMAQAIGTNSGGAGFMMTDASKIGSKGTQKSAMSDSTFTLSNTYGNMTFDFSMTYNWEIALNTSKKRLELNMSFTSTGSAVGPRVNSNGTSTGAYVFWGLLEADPFYVMNGTYKRNGTTIVKLTEDKTLNSEVNIIFKEVNLNKTNKKPDSGSAEITMTGTNSKGESFTFSGTLVYEIDGTATLTIGDKTYTVNVLEGSIQ